VKHRATLIAVWLLTGIGAVVGSILGGAGGKAWLFAGAIAGGALAALLAPRLCVRLGWMGVAQRGAASVGSVIGFLAAAPIAVTNLHTPVIPVLICSLAGVGALVGSGFVMRRNA
jgi:hypothetical protein